MLNGTVAHAIRAAMAVNLLFALQRRLRGTSENHSRIGGGVNLSVEIASAHERRGPPAAPAHAPQPGPADLREPGPRGLVET
jgi:hypothetical protein